MTAWPTSGRAVLGLALVLVLGAALRIDRLGLEELTTDEAFSWRMTTHAPSDIVARTATDVHPPLYYLVLEAWTSVAGESPAALRGLSLLLGLAAVVLAYLLYVEVDRHGGGGGTPAGRWGAVVAALLVAVHADQVGHSRHVRMYALGAALAGLTAWLVLRALRSERRAPGLVGGLRRLRGRPLLHALLRRVHRRGPVDRGGCLPGRARARLSDASS